MKVLCFIVTFSILWLGLTAQEDERQIFNKRVLFILDGSGSMVEQWQGESKWEMAVTTLSNLIDSFEQVNKDFEIGIRVLGHQYPKAMQRCDDTKLEIPFSKELTFQKVNTTLKQIHPKGYTPLAYSLAESEKDFTDVVKTQNVVVLITDGLENCNGNPCEVAERLREKNIFINPYIIGLGIDSLKSQNLECIGKYIDAKNKLVFRQVVKAILTEVAVKTTLTISFIQSDSSAYMHYVPFSLIDKRTGRDVQNFIYSPYTKRYKDTIQINPQFQYKLLVHSEPSFYVENFSITKGQHQHYTIPILSGTIVYDNPYRTKRNQFILRNKDFEYAHWHTGVQPFIRRTDSLLSLDYNMLPTQNYKQIDIKENTSFTIPTVQRGTVAVKKETKILASIYNKQWEKLISLNRELINTLDLAVGDYYLLYNAANEPSENTKYKPFKILENQTTNILIE